MALEVSSITQPLRELGKRKVGKKVVFCTPTIKQPYPQYLASLEAEIPLLDAAGWDHGITWMVGCAYISAARSIMLRRALDAKADVIVFIDHDLSWKPGDLLKLIETEGDVVAGTYRFKKDEMEWMGRIFTGPNDRPMVRADGCVHALFVPAGFLKVTREAVGKFIRDYPELTYGDPCSPDVDLFNHGAHEGVWFGEDYMFCKRWIDKGGDVWIVPDLDLTHWDGDTPYPGNFHQFLLAPPKQE